MIDNVLLNTAALHTRIMRFENYRDILTQNHEMLVQATNGVTLGWC